MPIFQQVIDRLGGVGGIIDLGSQCNDPRNPAQVLVGTDWGLYYTDDINAATLVWLLHEGLAHVMVWDMTIDRGFTTLAVFTRSRGAWAWPLPAALTDGMFADSFE